MCNTSLNIRLSSFRCRGLVWGLLAALVFSCVPSVSLAQQPTATISMLSGTVLVNGQEQGTGTVLSEGDVIETQAGATVVLELSDGSLLELGENTKVNLAELTQTATGTRVSYVKLLWGRIRAKLSSGHQQAGSSFNIETPNALVGVKFSQPDVEVSYDPAKQETIALALTVALAVKNLITDEEKMIPIGSVAIITALGIKVMAGAAVATGVIGAESAAGISTGTKIAISAGALAAAGGVAAVAASAGDGNGGNDGGNGDNSCSDAEPRLVSSSPANGATNVPVSNRTISFTFDQKMGPGYGVTWSDFELTVSSISWSSDKKTIYFVYSTDLPAGRTIGWVLNPSTYELNFRNECGVPLPADRYSGSFSTAN